MVVGVPAAGLHDVHVLPPHRVVDVHVRLPWSCKAQSVELQTKVHTKVLLALSH